MATNTPQPNEPTRSDEQASAAPQAAKQNGTQQGKPNNQRRYNKRPKKPVSKRQHEINRVADRVAGKLSERDGRALKSIQRIVRTFGDEFTLDYMKEALRIEADGGMMTLDNSRRRTPGGVFFFLVKQDLATEDRADMFPDLGYLKRRLRPPSPYPEMPWEERAEHLSALYEPENKGKVEDVTIQIKGRPGEIERRSEIVIISLEHKVEQLGAQPRGIPEWPERFKAATYSVFISERQWEQVERPLRNEQDFLILDGQFAYDEELGSVVVFATRVTTDQLEKKEKQRKQAEEQRKLAQQQKAKQGQKKKDKGGKQAQPQAKAQAKPQAKPGAAKQQQQKPQSAVDGVPAEIAKRVSDLRKAKATLEQKLSESSPGPAMKMTEKMLVNTQKQIEQFESQYPGLKK